ncbi:MAG: cytochrome c oxidase subunit 3 [Polyangiaceae bacterium]
MVPFAPGREPSFRASTSQIGMVVVLLSLSMLFGASLVAVLVTYSKAPSWTPLPLNSLWPGTALLVLLSLTMEWAARALRRNRHVAVQRGLTLVFLLGTIFVVAQAAALASVSKAAIPADRALPTFCFALLVILHALHVAGGLLAVAWVLRRAAGGEYSSSRRQGVVLITQYWHYLGGVWLVLLATLHAIF